MPQTWPLKAYSCSLRSLSGTGQCIIRARSFPRPSEIIQQRKFSFHVDDSTLVYLVSQPSLMRKLARWTLVLQEFKLNIYHQPKVQHAVETYLSRLESGESSDGVRDKFSVAFDHITSYTYLNACDHELLHSTHISNVNICKMTW